MADFDATQAIDLSDCDDETDDEVAEEDKKPVNKCLGLIKCAEINSKHYEKINFYSTRAISSW